MVTFAGPVTYMSRVNTIVIAEVDVARNGRVFILGGALDTCRGRGLCADEWRMGSRLQPEYRILYTCVATEQRTLGRMTGL